MCGIAGIWSKEEISTARRKSLEQASLAIAKRGPDFEGIHIRKKCWMAHRRLSIIDTSSDSNQPMIRGTYSLTFNGEIYNYRELREELIKGGNRFQTEGDTEVLLVGLINEGVNFLKKVNGFFAFGFYDESQNQLILARDRFGIKPLYFSKQDDEIVFGSGLGTITPFLKKKSIDEESLALYLSYSYVPFPNTILQGVQKLLTGTALVINENSCDEIKFYTLNQENQSGDAYETAQKRIRNLLQSSVERRMIADVPVGTFLSGGVDSSIITLLASRLDSKIPAFSIGFPNHSFFDESSNAQRIAKFLDIEHHILPITEEEIDEGLDQILDSMEEPFADSSAILVNLLSKFAKQKVKVSLSGDGADELFGGYNKHRALLRSTESSITNKILSRYAKLLKDLPASRNNFLFDKMRKLKKYAEGLDYGYQERYMEWASFTKSNRVAALTKKDPDELRKNQLKFINEEINENEFNTVLAADFRLVLPNDMLTKVDSMSMQHGLEVRVPFLDHQLVDYVFSLPSTYKLDRRWGKKVLKSAFVNDFPEDFFNGPKRGFEAPLTDWFKGPLKSKLDTLFNESTIKSQKLFDFNQVKLLIEQVMSPSPGDAPHTLWALLLFQHWYFRFFLDQPAVTPHL